MIELSGMIGTFLFAICSIPQALQSYKEKHSDGLNLSFILMWIGGEIFMLIYVWPKDDWILNINYIANLVLTFVILYYKLHPCKKACT